MSESIEATLSGNTRKKESERHIATILSPNSKEVSVLLHRKENSVKHLGNLNGRYGITGATKVFYDGSPVAAGTINSLTLNEYPSFVEDYKSSSGESFRIELSSDIFDMLMFVAYPFESNGDVITTPFAKHETIEGVRQEVEEHILRENERKTAATVDPEREAFSKGRGDGKEGNPIDNEWLDKQTCPSIKETYLEAYKMAA
ncbi:hypothetical protein [Vibrio alginolyticus]|uniref:hypothetical protein n=1 Tax=Vibrio TaxID=662 RepID=UPI0006CA93A8|nr:hypothetical protein [Vibrio alginolyticus]KPM98376.1 hypothetical protein AOG25_07980 [Vibrio alginolyticus]CAH7130644.1 conserved hypothetical protein [Vibrio chagasii]CAH7221922.1 conserved hypothetical protein [Vibrio chagasii]